MTFSEYLRRWSALHGGYAPEASRWVRGWLWLGYLVARPVARRVSPDAVTLAGGLLALVAAGAAWAGGRWALVAAALVLATALCDSVDGAIAVLRSRAGRAGGLWDSVADRCTEAAFAVSLVVLCDVARADVAALMVVAALLPGFVLEYARARAAAGGFAGIGVVTVGERPTRVLVTVFALAFAGADLPRAPMWAATGVAASALLGTWGVAAYLRHLMRQSRT